MSKESLPQRFSEVRDEFALSASHNFLIATASAILLPVLCVKMK
jgi:hypothetical protein